MKAFAIIAVLLTAQALEISSLKHHQSHVSLQDGNDIGSIEAFRKEQEMNKLNAQKKATADAIAKAEADEKERDPSGSMKLKRELDGERHKLGIYQDFE